MKRGGVLFPAPRCGRDRRGFTLVELVVTLSVLAVVAVSSVPFLQRWKGAVDVREAAADVAELMQLARMRSVVERREYTVSVNYTAESFQTQPAIRAARIPGSVDLFADTTDPDCPSLSSNNVRFRPNGSADAAGFEGVYIKSRNARVTARYRVKVLGATGKVVVERWMGGAWAGLY